MQGAGVTHLTHVFVLISLLQSSRDNVFVENKKKNMKIRTNNFITCKKHDQLINFSS